KKDALRQLADFLHEPDPVLWAGLADFALRRQITQAVEPRRKTPDGKGAEFTLRDQLRIALRPNGHSEVELITTDGNRPAEPMAEDPRRWVWNLFLTLSNLLWAAGGDNVVTTSKLA